MEWTHTKCVLTKCHIAESNDTSSLHLCYSITTLTLNLALATMLALVALWWIMYFLLISKMTSVLKEHVDLKFSEELGKAITTEIHTLL